LPVLKQEDEFDENGKKKKKKEERIER